MKANNSFFVFFVFARQFPNSFSTYIDFSTASIENPFVDFYSFPNNGNDPENSMGSVVLYGGLSGIDSAIQRRDPSRRRHLLVDAFYVLPLGRDVSIGGACPLPESEVLTPHDTYPLTILYMSQAEPKTVYACTDAVIVGIVDFNYLT